MKRLIVLCASCLAACGDNLPPPDGVDMTYRVAVTELEDTCSDGPLTPPATAFVDARLHTDGTVELVEWSLWIPGPGAYPSIRVRDGVVDYDAQRASAYTDKVFPYRIEGALTMEQKENYATLMRIAMLSSSAISATVPMRMELDRPVLPWPSCGTPHSGPTRGNSTKSSTMIGAPSTAVRSARLLAWRRLG